MTRPLRSLVDLTVYKEGFIHASPGIFLQEYSPHKIGLRVPCLTFAVWKQGLVCLFAF